MRRLGRLGRLPPGHGAAAAPRLRDFARAPLPPPPAMVDYTTGVSFRMFCNDALGCCTVSAWANAVLLRSSLALRTPLVMPDATVERLYGALSGWSADRPGSDVGCVETDVLAYFARTGVDLGRQAPEVTLWAALDVADRVALRQAVMLFGAAYVGLALPLSAMVQDVWDVPPQGTGGTGAPGSWGGHAVVIGGYDANHVDLVTWGRVQRCTWAFLGAYMDEAYALHSPGEWIGVGGLAPNHYDFAALANALASIS